MKSLMVLGMVVVLGWGMGIAQADPVGTGATALQSDVPGGQDMDKPMTPAAQGTKVDDKKIEDMIRQFIVSDKNLSLDAEKINITVFNGYVTLKGVVKDQTEKKAIERKAQGADDVKHVDDQLTVEN